LKQRQLEREAVPDPNIEMRMPSSLSGTTALEDLARAIEQLNGHGLDPGDAAVLYGHRILGLSMKELANISGESRRGLELRRRRAERELCA
jgi:hypothetical protein